MFIVSMKLSNLKNFIVVGVLVLVAIGGVAVLSALRRVDADAKATSQKLTASTAEERIEFLKQFGWEVENEPIEINEVFIPTEFDEVFEQYNIIQKKQGFDLSEIKGETVKRYCYRVKNYPANEDGTKSPNIVANILVFDNKVVGGDVCSTELNGFMHGFKIN